MLGAVGAAEPAKRSKILLDRAFCFFFLLVCLSGPVLISVGIITVSVGDNLTANIEEYNDAVAKWVGDAGGMKRLDSASFRAYSKQGRWRPQPARAAQSRLTSTWTCLTRC